VKTESSTADNGVAVHEQCFTRAKCVAAEGGTTVCPANPVKLNFSKVLCRTPLDACDLNDYCSATGGCTDVKAAAGTACTNGPSPTSFCERQECNGSGACGLGFDAAKDSQTCPDDQPGANDFICGKKVCKRPVAPDTEYCKLVKNNPAGTPCGDVPTTPGDQTISCLRRSECTDSLTCPTDPLTANESAQCRPSNGELCDVADKCTAGKCPDAVAPASQVCRAKASPCDQAEFCKGPDVADNKKCGADVCASVPTGAFACNNGSPYKQTA